MSSSATIELNAKSPVGTSETVCLPPWVGRNPPDLSTLEGPSRLEGDRMALTTRTGLKFGLFPSKPEDKGTSYLGQFFWFVALLPAPRSVPSFPSHWLDGASHVVPLSGSHPGLLCCPLSLLERGGLASDPRVGGLGR